MVGHDTALGEILAEKGSEIFQVSPKESVTGAVGVMNDKKIGSLLVLNNGKLVGIFTERDVLTRVVATGKNPEKTEVGEVMTRSILAVKPSTTVEEAMRIVATKKFRHLPVVDGDQIKGMISISDLTRWLVRIDESYIDSLEHYISGTYPG